MPNTEFHPLPELGRASLPWTGGVLDLAYRLRRPDTDGELPALVLVHGLGCSQRSFAGIWQQAAFTTRTVLSYDLPGFGDSHRPETFPYTMEAHAELSLALLRHLGLTAVHLVGHSMGGAVALHLAQHLARQSAQDSATEPRLRSLVSVEGNLIAADCGVSRLAAGMTRKRFEEEFFPSLRTRTPPLHRAFMALELASPRAFLASAESLWHWSRSEKLLQLYLALEVPRLYIHGRRDKGIPVLERLGDLPRRAVPDSGHFPMNENPAAFYRELAAWLEHCEAGTPSGTY